MNRNDTAYRWRYDEMGLLSKIIDGSFDEDLIIHGITFSTDKPNWSWPTAIKSKKAIIDCVVKTYGGAFPKIPQWGEIEDLYIKITSENLQYNTQISLYSKIGRCAKLKRLEIIVDTPKLSGRTVNFGMMCTNSSQLETAILRCVGDEKGTSTQDGLFQQCSGLKNLVLDSTTIFPLTKMPYQNSFANGGTGCTIYIPKSLYDHLGDGTEYDYKAATNWSTVDGYGTITWAQIEGSEYELA